MLDGILAFAVKAICFLFIFSEVHTLVKIKEGVSATAIATIVSVPCSRQQTTCIHQEREVSDTWKKFTTQLYSHWSHFVMKYKQL